MTKAVRMESSKLLMEVIDPNKWGWRARGNFLENTQETLGTTGRGKDWLREKKYKTLFYFHTIQDLLREKLTQTRESGVAYMVEYIQVKLHVYPYIS